MQVLAHWRGLAAAAYAAEFWLPWAQTGHRVRSGYNLAGVLHQTNIVPNRFVGAVVFCVLVMPALAALTVAADIARGKHLATIALVFTTLLVSACVVALRLSQLGPRVAAMTVVVVLGAFARRG